MENFVTLVFDLLTLLADTYKIYLKNGRLMAFIAVLIITFQTVLYLFNVFSFIPLVTDLIMNQSNQLLLASPGSPEFTKLFNGMLKDFKILVLGEWVFLLIAAIASLLFAVSTTYAAAVIHGGNKIFIKDLASRTIRSLQRPLVTWFYITLFVLGYLSLCLAFLLPFMLILGADRVTSLVSTVLFSISATVFYSYLSVVWNLSLVISVVEEKSGIGALGKAAQLVNGMKLQGFILNLLSTVLSVILFQCLRFIELKQSEAIRIVIAVVVASSIWMVRMFEYTAYTVLYYRCKKTHGEEVELQAADMDYTRIPTAPLNESIP